MLLAAALFAAQGCFLHNSKKPAAAPELAKASPRPTPAPQSSGAKIQIDYTHKGDYLRSLTVTKFYGAKEISSRPGGGGRLTVVRFEGGEPVWQIKAERGIDSLLGHLPGIGDNRKFAPAQVTYGVLPKNFVKVQPAQGAPEPLETGRYYIFKVKRAKGDTSYEAIHVDQDGTIEGYAAQPLISRSYELCCSVSPAFLIAAPNPAAETAEPDSP